MSWRRLLPVWACPEAWFWVLISAGSLIHTHGFSVLASAGSHMCTFSPDPGEGNGTPLQYSCLENPMDRGAWWAAVHGVATSQTRLSDFTFNFHFHALEKEMATCSSILAWRIPGTGEPGGLPSMGSQKSWTRLRDFTSLHF